MKQQIADEVRSSWRWRTPRRQQTAQQQDVDPGSSGIARMLTTARPHVFVAGSAAGPGGRERAGVRDQRRRCAAAADSSAADATAANLVVLASKGGRSARRSSTVTVQLTDLQEMQNQMRATIDQGLQELQAKQGKGGLPPAPPSAQAQAGSGGVCRGCASARSRRTRRLSSSRASRPTRRSRMWPRKLRRRMARRSTRPRMYRLRPRPQRCEQGQNFAQVESIWARRCA